MGNIYCMVCLFVQHVHVEENGNMLDLEEVGPAESSCSRQKEESPKKVGVIAFFVGDFSYIMDFQHL